MRIETRITLLAIALLLLFFTSTVKAEDLNADSNQTIDTNALATDQNETTFFMTQDANNIYVNGMITILSTTSCISGPNNMCGKSEYSNTIT